jgi:NTE family protein
LQSELKKDYGLFSGETVLEWTEKLIYEKTGITKATFKELHDLKLKGKPILDVYFIGTNISTSFAEVFSYEHTPDLVISDALRISMSIPFIFKPHRCHIKLEGERVPFGPLYIDGGVGDNYPIWLFDKQKYQNTAIENSNSFVWNRETLGFRFVSKDRKKHYEHGVPLSGKEVNSLGSFVMSVVSCLYSKQEIEHRKSDDIKRTVYINDCGVTSVDFDIENEKKKQLVESGFSAVTDYFKDEL